MSTSNPSDDLEIAFLRLTAYCTAAQLRQRLSDLCDKYILHDAWRGISSYRIPADEPSSKPLSPIAPSNHELRAEIERLSAETARLTRERDEARMEVRDQNEEIAGTREALANFPSESVIVMAYLAINELARLRAALRADLRNAWSTHGRRN